MNTRKNTRNGDMTDVRMPTAAELLASTDPTAEQARGSGAERGRALTAVAEKLGVAEPADARAMREAADAEPGVRARSCLIRADEETGTTTVTVSVAVAYGIPLHEVAERVRARVAEAAVEVLGLPARKKGRAGGGKKAAATPGLRVDVKVVWIDEPGG